MGIFDKFQEKVKNCYQILAKNCQFLKNIYTWTANLGGSNFFHVYFLSIVQCWNVAVAFGFVWNIVASTSSRLSSTKYLFPISLRIVVKYFHAFLRIIFLGLMPSTRTGRFPITRCTTTSWTAFGTRGRTPSRSTPSLVRSSPSRCSTERRRELMPWRLKLEMVPHLQDQIVEEDQIQVGE